MGRETNTGEKKAMLDQGRPRDIAAKELERGFEGVLGGSAKKEKGEKEIGNRRKKLVRKNKHSWNGSFFHLGGK